MMINVLIVPAGTEIWLEIYNALINCKDINLFWGNENKSNHAMFIYKNFFWDVLPINSGKQFIEQIKNIVKSAKIDVIYPASDDCLVELSKFKDELWCQIIAPNDEACLITRSKKMTYDKLHDILPIPKMFGENDVTEADFPVFIKPEKWAWAVNSFKVENKEELDFYLKKYENLIILEYLPWDEFTIDCFTSKGKLIYVWWRKRVRIKNGIAVNSTTLMRPEFKLLAEKINARLDMDWARFFQLKHNIYWKLALLEVAPRISWTMSTNRVKWINFPLLSIYNKLGYDTIDICINDYNVTVDRALANKYSISNIDYDTVYIDLDDTIIVKWEINLLAIHFLYQCINKWYKIVLLTKSEQEHVIDYIKKYKISEVFDEIIKISKDDEKHKHITYKKSIFIDDSFWERKKVKDNLWIPVFDLSSLECLLDYKK